MNGYMDLFLETGNPAFYMMAKQEGKAASAATGGASNRLESPMAEKGASPR